MKSTLSIIILFLSLSVKAQDQAIPQDSVVPGVMSGRASVYHVNRWVTGTIVVAGAAGSLATIAPIRNKPEISVAELDSLKTDGIYGFDSWALDQPLPDADMLSTYALATQLIVAALPLTLFFDKEIRQDWGDILWMMLEVNAVAVSLYEFSPLGPLFQNKFRPMVYYEGVPLEDRKVGNNRNSFYSGHVASATTSTLFMAKVYSDYNPDANKFLLYSAAAVPPLFLGYLRLAALKHFPSDILVGYGVGILCGVLIPQFHRLSDEKISLGTYTSPAGTGITMQVVVN